MANLALLTICTAMPCAQQSGKSTEEEFERGVDIMDIWFDSGSSWASVLESKRNNNTRKPLPLSLNTRTTYFALSVGYLIIFM